jgi:hypothetical protein
MMKCIFWSEEAPGLEQKIRLIWVRREGATAGCYEHCDEARCSVKF